jgi:hypothetical protein
MAISFGADKEILRRMKWATRRGASNGDAAMEYLIGAGRPTARAAFLLALGQCALPSLFR